MKIRPTNIVTAFVHITLVLFTLRADAHNLSAFSELDENLLPSNTHGSYHEGDTTHLTAIDLPCRDSSTAYTHVWPELELNWRVAAGSIIFFIGGSLGCAGGIGGGGIFVPILILVVGFDEKSSTALSKCMIMGASAAASVYNFGIESPVLDFDLALVFQPMLMLGISIGVIFNVIFPNWIVTVLLIVLFTGTTLKTFLRALTLYKQETMEKQLDKEGLVHKSLNTDHQTTESIDLEPYNVASSNSLRRQWRSFVALGYVWITFLFLQVAKNYTTACSSYYWLWTLLQVPVAASVFFTKAIQLYVRNRRNDAQGVQESLIPAPAQLKWTIPVLCLCGFTGLLAGTVGGLLGLGGGFIIGPLFLELGLLPEVASATASFIMLFSSSMSVVEYYLLQRFPVPFALYLVAINVVAAIWAQLVLRKLIDKSGRASIIVFIVAFAILLSAVCLGGYGIEDSLSQLRQGEYMGFLSLC